MGFVYIDGQMRANGAFPLTDGSQITGSPIIAASLNALENYTIKLSTMIIGQWGYAQDTGKIYTLTTIGNPPTTLHTWTELSTGGTPVDISNLVTKDTFAKTYKNNQSLFLDNYEVASQNAENDCRIFRLRTTPTSSAEVIHTASATSADNAKIFAHYYVDTEMNRAEIKQGVWKDKMWCSVSDGSANNTIIKNLMSVVGVSGQDLTTITGTGTIRQAYIIQGNLEFAPSDGNTDPKLAGRIQTPKGSYQIYQYQAPNYVDILVPAGYVNETFQDLKIHRNIGQIVIPNITNTTPQEITTFTNVIISGIILPQTASLSVLTFIETANVGSVDFNIYVNGYERYSHLETPETLLRKSNFYEAAYDGNYQDYPVAVLNAGQSTYLPLGVPLDADDFENIYLMYIPSANTSGVDIDLSVKYANDLNGNIAQYTAADTTTTYIVFANLFNLISLKDLLVYAKRGMTGSLKVTMNTATLSINILGIAVTYK